MPDNNEIQKTVILKASRDRVWHAIANSAEFGRWFGVRFDQDFAPGARISGSITPTEVDADVASAQSPYEGMPFEIVIERIEPQSVFSFRWHPYAVDSAVDYTAERMTLVAFTLEEVSEGVRLTVTESGFDQIPLDRRAAAFTANDGGWTAQMRLIEKYLVTHA